ncbi:hypothetical protein MMC18_004221 [Xylographa bjoerkii]|nr:hypothetical protein [Xylographa bjoerkii]
MASHEIINLLSSDEDELPPDLPAPAATSTVRPSLGGFVDLSDDFDFPFDAPTETTRAKLATTKIFSTTLIQQVEVDTEEFSLPVPKRRRRSKTKELSDPIFFTSSPKKFPWKPSANKRASEAVRDLQDELDEYLSDTLGQPPALGSKFSIGTNALLTEIDSNKKRLGKKNTKLTKLGSKEVKVSKAVTNDGLSNSRTQSPGLSVTLPKAAERTKVAKKPRITSAERELKEQEREQAKIQKEREKEEDKERKKIVREEKEKEKQKAAVLAEVNKSKADKKTSTPEMIVDLPASIKGETVDVQVREFLKVLGVEISTKQSPVPNVIRWRRKARSRFNEELGHWEPMSETIISEKHIMCLVSAREFVSLAVSKGAGEENLEGHVRKLKNTFLGCIPIYLIEGLDAWSRKAKNSKNRAYQAAVQSQMDNTSEPSATQAKGSKSKRKQPEETFVDEDLVEDALLRLQVIEGCLVHQTAASMDTAEWIQNFTQHISTIPYKKRRTNLEVSFCMDVGQVKTGDDKDDTFIKMLQEIIRVTAPIAYGIAAEYPNVVSLVAAFKEHGPLVLEDLKKTANSNGSLTETRIGPAIKEHHIANFDPGAFFSLHDYDSSGGWTPDEVRRTYGLDDESARDVSAEKREEVTREVYRLFDMDKNGIIEREEWMALCESGVRLPDFGLGPGHHGDDEYEYEIHHFEKFHNENTKEEDLIHPEDIAHFAKHDREEAEAERQEVLNRQAINEANIPQKFRRQ